VTLPLCRLRGINQMSVAIFTSELKQYDQNYPPSRHRLAAIVGQKLVAVENRDSQFIKGSILVQGAYNQKQLAIL
jgi:hypothetical protein